MNHEELLEMCQDQWHQTNGSGAANALRAVVELHKPAGGECDCCIKETSELGGWIEYLSYPCPTIQAIEKELQ